MNYNYIIKNLHVFTSFTAREIYHSKGNISQQGKYATAREIYYSKGNILQQGKYTTTR
jgi:hypothetical protein